MSSWSFSRSDLLQLAFSHAQILVHRPFLINSLNSLSGQVQENGSGRLRHEEIRKNVQLCVDAATEITKHVNYINDAGELYKLRLEVLRNNTSFLCHTGGLNYAPRVVPAGRDLLLNKLPRARLSADPFRAFHVGLFNMINWAQFDSLVTGGTGNFDALVHDDSADLWGHGSDVRLNPRSVYSSPSRQVFERFLTQLRRQYQSRERWCPGKGDTWCLVAGIPCSDHLC
ncbi:finger protein [Colletotrichum abscissum]